MLPFHRLMWLVKLMKFDMRLVIYDFMFYIRQYCKLTVRYSLSPIYYIIVIIVISFQFKNIFDQNNIHRIYI